MPGRGRRGGRSSSPPSGRARCCCCCAWRLFRPLAVTGEPPRDGFVRVPAVFHVHTTLSDGGGTPEEVIAAAREAGVAVLGITDHNNVDAKPFEGYRDGVLVLVGSELSTPAGHVLGVGLERDPAFRFGGDGQDAIDDVLHLGGVPFAAHPFSPRADLRFTGFGLPGPWGLELLNGDSDARRAGPRLLLTAFLYRLNPDYALLAAATGIEPVARALGRAPRRARRRRPRGSRRAQPARDHAQLAALRFPSYQALFRQARNHLLLAEPLRGDAAADRAAVLEALRAGRFYIGLRRARAGRRLLLHGRGRGGRPLHDGRPRSTPSARARCERAPAGGSRRARGSSCGATAGWWGRRPRALELRSAGPGRLPRGGLGAGLAGAVGHHEPRLRLRPRRAAGAPAAGRLAGPARAAARERPARRSRSTRRSARSTIPARRWRPGCVAPGAGPGGRRRLRAGVSAGGAGRRAAFHAGARS